MAQVKANKKQKKKRVKKKQEGPYLSAYERNKNIPPPKRKSPLTRKRVEEHFDRCNVARFAFQGMKRTTLINRCEHEYQDLGFFEKRGKDFINSWWPSAQPKEDETPDFDYFMKESIKICCCDNTNSLKGNRRKILLYKEEMALFIEFMDEHLKNMPNNEKNLLPAISKTQFCRRKAQELDCHETTVHRILNDYIKEQTDVKVQPNVLNNVTQQDRLNYCTKYTQRHSRVRDDEQPLDYWKRQLGFSDECSIYSHGHVLIKNKLYQPNEKLFDESFIQLLKARAPESESQENQSNDLMSNLFIQSDTESERESDTDSDQSGSISLSESDSNDIKPPKKKRRRINRNKDPSNTPTGVCSNCRNSYSLCNCNIPIDNNNNNKSNKKKKKSNSKKRKDKPVNDKILSDQELQNFFNRASERRRHRNKTVNKEYGKRVNVVVSFGWNWKEPLIFIGEDEQLKNGNTTFKPLTYLNAKAYYHQVVTPLKENRPNKTWQIDCCSSHSSHATQEDGFNLRKKMRQKKFYYVGFASRNINKKYRRENGYPSRSPDLMPPELPIFKFKYVFYNKMATNIGNEKKAADRIKYVAQLAWEEISQELLNKCILHCWNNMKECVEVEGDYGPSFLSKKIQRARKRELRILEARNGDQSD